MAPHDPADSAPLPSVRWAGGIDGHLILLDQTRLPLEETLIECRDVDALVEAIRALRVRGAPAIGIAAAYGICLAASALPDSDDRLQWQSALTDARARLAASRPTAVNLFWALDRMTRVVEECINDSCVSLSDLRRRLLAEAHAVREEDRQMCHAIGRFGAELLPPAAGVLTHCNAGGLATADYGTALGVIFTAHDQGKSIHVYVDETRPLLQGARLTTWELEQHGVPHTLICDSMAAQVMREGRVQAVITGADRIAANGDAANKIGTYGLALLAEAHHIPFYVAAPSSTFDLQLPDGDAIPIEQRSADEITCGFGRRTAPHGVEVYNPAFDVTPARLIAGLITERGVIAPVSPETIGQTLAAGRS